jgi:spoIIIJ-associated protein
MEWVETTAKTIDAAREVALDQLGVAVDEAEIEILEEPKAGLFGRTRGEARVRARVKPTPVRAKQERRRRSRSDKSGGSSGRSGRGRGQQGSGDGNNSRSGDHDTDQTPSGETRSGESAPAGTGEAKKNGSAKRGNQSRKQEQKMSTTDGPNGDEGRRDDREPVSPQEVGDAAVAFMDGLTTAFGASGTSALAIEGTELDVTVTGEGLGLLVGSGGRTLNAIQDLVRVAAQRRLGDHETRLRIDVAGYRERRQAALATFATGVAEEVRSSNSPRSMEPMNSADRKVIHDVLNEEDGVETRSEGEDPNRRIVVLPVGDSAD